MNHKEVISNHLQEKRVKIDAIDDPKINEYVTQYEKKIKDQILNINPLNVSEGPKKLLAIQRWENDKNYKCQALKYISAGSNIEGFHIAYESEGILRNLSNKCQVSIDIF